MRCDCLAIRDYQFNDKIICVFKGIPPNLNQIIDKYNIMKSKHEIEICYNNGNYGCSIDTNYILVKKIHECHTSTDEANVWHRR